MRRIIKFSLQANEVQQRVRGPIVNPLSIGYDECDKVCLWAECDTNAVSSDFTISLIRTGDALPSYPGNLMGVINFEGEIYHAFIKVS